MNRLSARDLLRWLLLVPALGFALWVESLLLCVWNDSASGYSWLPFFCWAAAVVVCLVPCRGNPADAVMMAMLASLFIGPVALFGVWFEGEPLHPGHFLWLLMLLTDAALIRFRPGWRHPTGGRRRQHRDADSLAVQND